jgi:hypothetical protein
MKQDGSGAVSSSQRVEEFNWLLLEIEAAAAQVKLCVMVSGLRNFRSTHSTKKEDSTDDHVTLILYATFNCSHNLFNCSFAGSSNYRLCLASSIPHTGKVRWELLLLR